MLQARCKNVNAPAGIERAEGRCHMSPSLMSMRKIEKAKDYALQKERVRFTSCTIRFQGDNGDHTISYDGERWGCDCDYIIGRESCTHIMAMELMLEGMVENGV